MEPVTQFDTTLVAGNVKAAMRNVQAISRELWAVNVSDIRILDDFNVRIHDSAWETHIRALASLVSEPGYLNISEELRNQIRTLLDEIQSKKEAENGISQ